jgi:hypothetical protein
VLTRVVVGTVDGFRPCTRADATACAEKVGKVYTRVESIDKSGGQVAAVYVARNLFVAI